MSNSECRKYSYADCSSRKPSYSYRIIFVKQNSLNTLPRIRSVVYRCMLFFANLCLYKHVCTNMCVSCTSTCCKESVSHLQNSRNSVIQSQTASNNLKQLQTASNNLKQLRNHHRFHQWWVASFFFWIKFFVFLHTVQCSFRNVKLFFKHFSFLQSTSNMYRSIFFFFLFFLMKVIYYTKDHLKFISSVYEYCLLASARQLKMIFRSFLLYNTVLGCTKKVSFVSRQCLTLFIILKLIQLRLQLIQIAPIIIIIESILNMINDLFTN